MLFIFFLYVRSIGAFVVIAMENKQTKKKYTEEIFTTPEAIWSSDDGSHLMYVSFNDTQVGTMVYPWFDSGAVMAVHSFGSTSFPETRTVRYPTPGSKNPDVKLMIVNVTNTSAIQQYPVTPPITLDGQ